MPEYRYRCEDDHRQNIIERMLYSTARFCASCGTIMKRIPWATQVNWGGNLPSNPRPPVVEKFLDPNGIAARRDAFAEEHEAHEQRTSD